MKGFPHADVVETTFAVRTGVGAGPSAEVVVAVADARIKSKSAMPRIQTAAGLRLFVCLEMIILTLSVSLERPTGAHPPPGHRRFQTND